MTIAKLSHLIGRIISIFIINLFFFAYIGIAFLGGHVFQGHVELQDGPFFLNNYFCYNFNDFPNSLIALFNMQIINNWNLLFDGYEK